MPMRALSTYGSEARYFAPSIWSCVSQVPRCLKTTLRNAFPRAPVPRLSTLAMMYPLRARYWYQMLPPSQAFDTVCEPGPPYTVMRTGYFFDGSKGSGLIIHPLSCTPSEVVNEKSDDRLIWYPSSAGFLPSSMVRMTLPSDFRSFTE